MGHRFTDSDYAHSLVCSETQMQHIIAQHGWDAAVMMTRLGKVKAKKALAKQADGPSMHASSLRQLRITTFAT